MDSYDTIVYFAWLASWLAGYHISLFLAFLYLVVCGFELARSNILRITFRATDRPIGQWAGNWVICGQDGGNINYNYLNVRMFAQVCATYLPVLASFFAKSRDWEIKVSSFSSYATLQVGKMMMASSFWTRLFGPMATVAHKNANTYAELMPPMQIT